MAVTLSNLQPQKGSQGRKKRLGRGDGSGYGTYSGRGQKGQRSRSGGKKGLKLKGMRRNIRNLPKLRGFKSKAVRPEVVHLEDIGEKFKSGDTIDPQKLKKFGLISEKTQKIKILCKTPQKSSDKKLKKSGNKKFTIKAHAISSSAQKLIRKAGGKVIVIQ
ncbi:50S ribosomal protein L15 [Patescibacteria group bacterium AH-259-L05]|nr:50S ribosomal protein L15 [Patescibacteria group bacterium AH-259-L05]